MSSFSRFQERNQILSKVKDKVSSNFILKGYPTTKITNIIDNIVIDASVVNYQDKDYVYIYTNIDNTLSPGEIWSVKDLNILIVKQITIIKDVEWNKYYGLVCNVQIDNLWGYFKGPEKSFTDISLKKETVWESNQKPVLVLPNNSLSFRDKVVINHRAWLVQDYDNISDSGITYYSLTPTTVNKTTVDRNINNDNYIERHNNNSINIIDVPVFDNDVIRISPNTTIDINTEDGYFKTSNSNIVVLNRIINKVSFQINFGVTEDITIETKKKGDIIRRIYRVVE